MPNNGLGHRGTSFSLAEVGSLQLEFRYLWHATNREDIKNLVMSRACWVFRCLTSQILSSGLLSERVDARGRSLGNEFHVGAGADSFYEYMLKTHLQDVSRGKLSRNARRSRLKLRRILLASFVRATAHGRGIPGCIRRPEPFRLCGLRSMTNWERLRRCSMNSVMGPGAGWKVRTAGWLRELVWP